MRGLGVWIATILAVAALVGACAVAQPRERDFSRSEEISLNVDGRQRAYGLYVPRSARGLLPLIIVLHGTQGSGAKMEIGLGFDAYAERQGFAVAYPDAFTPAGERRSWRWNDGRGTLKSAQQGVDDVAFLRALVADAGPGGRCGPARAD